MKDKAPNADKNPPPEGGGGGGKNRVQKLLEIVQKLIENDVEFHYYGFSEISVRAQSVSIEYHADKIEIDIYEPRDPEDSNSDREPIKLEIPTYVVVKVTPVNNNEVEVTFAVPLSVFD